MERALVIIPIGAVPKALARDLGDRLAEVLGCSTELIVGLGEPKYAFNATRSQHHATAILRRVGQAMNPKKHFLALGVCEVDLFAPDVNFVFGEADRALNAALISSARLKPSHYGRPPDGELLLRRLASESLHELGHVMGLPVCSNDHCAMFVANTLSDTDRKHGRFCEACKHKLAAA